MTSGETKNLVFSVSVRLIMSSAFIPRATRLAAGVDEYDSDLSFDGT